ncbi:MAG: metallophosphoesterase [bacterium]|nr:metallophosphoesterase [Betaproteobacteria bacterium]
MTAYDIIGDIHGYAAPLESLLRRMGYVPHGTSWRAPHGRKAIFVGDLIDRGPEQVRVVETVRSMVDDGQALCVLGNHEFNAIGWATRRLGADGYPIPESAPDAWLKKHTARNLGNHAAFLAQVNEGSALHADMIRWFRTLPVALDLGGIRVAHAWWNDTLVRQLGERLRDGLDDAFLQAAARKGSPEWLAMEGVTKGLEATLPGGLTFVDHSGVERSEVRLRWWLPTGSSWRATAFVSDEARERLCDRTPVPDCDGFGEVEGAPVFIGHYWMDGPRVLQSPRVACCDYSVPRSGRLVAYRWEGERELVAGNFVESDG